MTTRDPAPPRLGDELVQLEPIGQPWVEAAAACGVSVGWRLGEVLLVDMLVDEADLWLALADQRSRPFQRAEAWAGRVDRGLLQRFFSHGSAAGCCCQSSSKTGAWKP